MRLSANVAKNGIRVPRDVMTSMTRRVAANSARLPVNVWMAVVLRPIQEATGLVFVPALRVGVEPKSVPVDDGYRTDAAEAFYIDLVRGSAEFADADERDASQSRQ